MTQFQSALILAGVGVVLLVYLYNWWQSVRRRREIERAVAAHSGAARAAAGADPLQTPATAPVSPAAEQRPAVVRREPAGRVEPVIVDTPSQSAPSGVATDGRPGDAAFVRGAAAGSRVPVIDEAIPLEADDEPFAGPADGPAPPDAQAGRQAMAPQRAEPVMQPSSVALRDPEPAPAEPPRPRAPRPASSGLALRPDPPDLDSRVDYLVRLLPMEPVLAEDLSEMLSGAPDVGRRMTVLGCPVGSQDWQPVLRQSVRYEELAFALQQVDRGGLIERSSLDRFARWVDEIAERLSAACSPPDTEQAHAVAAAFDTFCAEADVLIGINVVAPDVPVPATKIRALVEAAGFRLQAQGQYTLEDEDGLLLLTLSDIDGEPFVADRIRTAAMSGITLLLDIPRTRRPARVFNQMMQIARQVAQGIGGRVVDDQRQALGDAGVRLIAERIAALENRLTAQQMMPGSALARRVFA